ncbi:hypothetical protein ASE12_09660 [Aeromicrobium sp. Root236]|uniref:hypothetical protein n=1 Tax=Aeromicrobium sp. Root236 TaxID=1736498 RepID=UPI0006F3202F|nr:hypothetical protein [Aeromicrobium sp. Root236]KRC65004.1 hypothetical protein ASE12_09660 [Aeromicrobium sp. Root236]
MRRIGAALVTTIMGAAVLGGCSGGSDPNRAPKPSARTLSVEAALRELPPIRPSADQPLQVFASDFALAAELGKLPEPKDQQATSRWRQGLGGPKIAITGGEGLGLGRVETGAMRKVLGFDARDITTTASVESLPDTLTVVHLADGVSPKHVATTGAGKIGDLDPAGASDAPFPQIFGVAQRGDEVAIGKTQRALDAWKTRGQRSLADDDAFLEVAQSLDAHRIYDVVLSDRPADPRFLVEQMRDEMPATMPAFDAVGVAQGFEDGEAIEYIAYRLKDVAGAEERIRTVWEDGFSDDMVWFQELLNVEDVSTEGNVVTVKIAPRESAGTAAQMLIRGDTPFFVLE